jgi:hypothetical protein
VKHLKSSSSDLRRLFERAITIREIAEPLVSFDTDRNAEAIRAYMEARNFDVVGLRNGGRLAGYVRRKGLKQGPVQGCLTRFREGEVLTESEPLSAAIQALQDRNELFITVLGQVGGIVTKGDLQKTPVRLWLFGLISLVEMQMLRLIRERFPDGAWTSLLTPARLGAAKRIFAERQRRNQEVDVSDFSDCLQFCDKTTIMLKDSELSAWAKLPGRAAGRRFFTHLESLRNDLAHSNDILKGRWPGLAELAVQCENLLTCLEAGQVRLPEFAEHEIYECKTGDQDLLVGTGSRGCPVVRHAETGPR